MKYQDDNKVIAEFMGIVYTKDSYEAYHVSWDWLMPVIQKCLVGEAEQSEEISNTTIKNIYEAICNQDIHYAHKSAVQFIKTQNND